MTSGHPYLRRRVRPVRASAPTATAATPARPPTPPTVTPPVRADGGGVGGLSLSFGGQAAGPSHTAAAPSSPRTIPPATTRAAPPAASTSATKPGRSERVARRLAARAARVVPFPAPDPRDVRVLDAETPVVRIDRRRSAVGTLAISGCTSAVWETVDRLVGASTADGVHVGRQVMTTGNRPLVGFEDGQALVALRHVRQLRRALFTARGPERLVVALHDGTTVAVDPGSADTMSILALSVIDGELELRVEPFPRASHDGEVFAAFGFTLSAPSTGA